MVSFKQYLQESVNDKGILKAVFFGGLPGSGKSTIIRQITDGAIHPKLINTDKAFEFLASKMGEIPSSTLWPLLGKPSKRITTNMLFQCINSMLPLFVDTTSSNINAINKRIALLENVGYDIKLVWVNVSLKTAIQRAKQRSHRQVDISFIERIHSTMEENKQWLKNKHRSMFTEIDNNGNNFKDQKMKIISETDSFFNSSLKNPIGKQIIEKLKEQNKKYLTPTIYSKEYIEKLISVWYSN